MILTFERLDKVALLTLATVTALNYQFSNYNLTFLMPVELYTHFPAIIHQELFPPTRSIDKLIPGIEHSASTLRLPNSGQIFCFVETSERYYNDRVPSIAATWLRRCDNGRFFSKTPLPSANMTYSTVYKNLEDSFFDLFRKSIFGFYYSYMHISNSFDWYLKADDDTYFAMDHLREYLNTLDPSKPLYLGYVIKSGLKNGYNSGGAGYILSNAAVKIFVEKLYHDEYGCPYDWAEDRGMGRCLARVGIYPTDTRDDKGFNRFMPYRPSEQAAVEAGQFSSQKFVSLHRFPQDTMLLLDELLHPELRKNDTNPVVVNYDFFRY